MVMPGDNVAMDVELIQPIAMEPAALRDPRGDRPSERISEGGLSRQLNPGQKERKNTRKGGKRGKRPDPLPTVINKYCALRSPHVDKKSREQFEIRTHKRLIDILERFQQTVDSLMKLDPSAGVDVVEIKS